MSENTPRILFTIPAWGEEYGGPYHVVRALTSELNRLGASCRILTTDLADSDGNKHQAGDEEHDGIRVTRLKALLRYNWASIAPEAPGEILKMMRDPAQRPDVVHVCGYRDGLGAMAGLLAGKMKIPVCWEPMGMARAAGRSLTKKWLYDRSMGRVTLHRADCIIATSEVEKNEHYASGIPKIKSRIRGNGLGALAPGMDLLRLAAWRSTARRELGFHKNRQKIALYLGRIEGRKGLDFVSRVMAREELQDWKLAVVGPDEDGTLDRVKDQLGNRLIAPGPIYGDKKWLWYGVASAFVLASPYGENFAISALESAACGTPVFLSPAVGFGSEMPEGVGKVLQLKESLWSQELQAVVADGRQDMPLSISVVQKVREMFSWSTIAALQMDIYRDLMAGGK